jgi:Domain of unknown function (DUF4258)
MIDDEELLPKIRNLISARKYRIRLHAVRHMVEEGFTERDIIAAIGGKSRILEDYSEESRCLIMGYFRLSDKIRCPLHVVCDYSDSNVLDIVTTYIPEKPWWSTPRKRGRNK